jgi:hypothetical protein
VKRLEEKRLTDEEQCCEELAVHLPRSELETVMGQTDETFSKETVLEEDMMEKAVWRRYHALWTRTTE